MHPLCDKGVLAALRDILKTIHSADIFCTPTVSPALCSNESSERVKQRSSVFAKYSSLTSKFLLTISSVDRFYLKPAWKELPSKNQSYSAQFAKRTASSVRWKNLWHDNMELWGEGSVPLKSSNRKAMQCGSSLHSGKMEFPPPSSCPLLRGVKRAKGKNLSPHCGTL